jgi:hypothetical protein
VAQFALIRWPYSKEHLRGALFLLLLYEFRLVPKELTRLQRRSNKYEIVVLNESFAKAD